MNYGHLTELWTFGDTKRAARGEVQTDSEAGPEALAGAGVVVSL